MNLKVSFVPEFHTSSFLLEKRLRLIAKVYLFEGPMNNKKYGSLNFSVACTSRVQAAM